MTVLDDSVRADLIRWGHMTVADDLSVGVQSFQQFFSEELESAVRRYHGRGLRADGELGPCTYALLGQDRCDFPDKHYSGDWAQANWPEDCRERLKFHIELDNLSLDDRVTRERFQAALDDWSSKLVLRADLTEDFTESHVFARGGPLGGSTLAWSQIARNRCDVRLEQRYNTRTNWTEQYFQGTAGHEQGHAWGMGHLRDPKALMYPYMRSNIWRATRADIDYMVALGYRERTGPIPDPDPDPDPIPQPRKLLRISLWWSDDTRQDFDNQ